MSRELRDIAPAAPPLAEAVGKVRARELARALPARG